MSSYNTGTKGTGRLYTFWTHHSMLYIRIRKMHLIQCVDLCDYFSWLCVSVSHLRSTPPSREALRHSGGERRLWTSATVTLYLEVELSRERRPGTEQNTSVGLDTIPSRDSLWKGTPIRFPFGWVTGPGKRDGVMFFILLFMLSLQNNSTKHYKCNIHPLLRFFLLLVNNSVKYLVSWEFFLHILVLLTF